MKPPNIFAFCPSYGRPQCVANIIWQWERMDYPDELRELLILDDGNQYRKLEGRNWPGNVSIVSLSRRFASLGEKQNACVSFSRPEHDLIVVIEDDDYYAPWTLQAHAAAFQKSQLSIPSQFFIENKRGRFVLTRNRRQHDAHAGWAFSRDLFRRVEGYPWIDLPTDHHLWLKFQKSGIAAADPLENFPPYLISRLHSNSDLHLSRVKHDDPWAEAGRRIDTSPVDELPAALEYDFKSIVRSE